MSNEKYYHSFCETLRCALDSLQVSVRGGQLVETEKGFELLCQKARAIRDAGRNMFLCGNGASAAFANHMALDWTKAGGVPTFSFSDSALLTAMGNDLGYEHAFSAPLSWYAKSGDLLVTISSSGDSPNILKTIEVARLKGMEVVTFSGMNAENRSRALGDMNLYVPSRTYGVTESAHQVLLHVWLDKFVEIPYGHSNEGDS